MQREYKGCKTLKKMIKEKVAAAFRATDHLLYSSASGGRPATCWPTSQSTWRGCLWPLVTGKDQSRCRFMQRLSRAKASPACSSSCPWNQTDSVFCHAGIFFNAAVLFILTGVFSSFKKSHIISWTMLKSAFFPFIYTTWSRWGGFPRMESFFLRVASDC